MRIPPFDKHITPSKNINPALPRQSRQVWAVLWEAAAARAVGEVATARFTCLPAQFAPSYEWALIAEGQSVPPGLEVPPSPPSTNPKP